MSVAKGSASFKKKDGTVILTQTQEDIQWTPTSPPGAAVALTIPIPSITNLQATPATSAKAMIKVFAMPSPSQPVEQYVFTFTHPTSAREEANIFKDALTAAIQAAKDKAANPMPAAASGEPSTTGDGLSGPLALMNASISRGETWTRAQLEADMELQQSLLSSSQDLMKTFHETVITGNVTATQFWSTRTHLLRAHATERAQIRGSYNVLAAIKPKTENDVLKMNLTRDQIHDIFAQHPIVKRVYDECVPKLSEDAFWSRFFLSRLFKKLKGERLVPTDAYDEVLDPYLKMGDEENLRRSGVVMPGGSAHVPLFIDLEGNEENHSQRQGNRPDLTMRPNAVENVPIIRTLNSLSNKIMDSVAPADGDGREEDRDALSMDQLRLTDLQGDDEQERIILNITDQTRFFEDNKRTDTVKDIDGVRKDPQVLLHEIREEVTPDKLNLVEATTFISEADDPDAMSIDNHGTSTIHLAKATDQILSNIRIRRSQMDDVSHIASNTGTINGLPEHIFDRLVLSQATTTEFLRHFWNAFLSGDEKRVGEITNMVESLRRSKERIEAVASAAEEERNKEKDRVRAEQEAREREGKKRRKRRAEDEVGGGREVVMGMIGPSWNAIEVALGRYEQAVRESEGGEKG